MLQMVRDNDGTVLPTVNTKNVDDLWGYASCGVGDCTVAGYNMNGYDVESDILRWDGPSLTVSTSDTFSLQISEGCCGTSVSDNRGIGCADVYFEYESIFVKELATNNACFSASKHLEDYKFSPPYSGKLKAVELHHISGDVTCSYNRVGTHWGCYTGSGEPTMFMLQMVRDNDGTVLPTVNTKNVDDLWGYASCGVGDCTVAGYNMNGYDVESDILRWDGPSLTVSTSDTFSLQISEGCCGTSVSDNRGIGCADVYFEYESIFVKELATNNACYSASKHLEDYKFSPPYSGKLKAVELHHISGDVTCSYNRVGTHW